MGSRKVVKQDPEADAQKAKDKATAEANQEAALKRRGGGTALASASTQTAVTDQRTALSNIAVQNTKTKLGQ